MRALVIALLLFALVPVAGAADPTGRAFVEISTPRATVRVGEVFTVRLVVGYDRAFFHDHVVPVFRRAMDVPLQILAPDLDDPDGATRLPASSEWGDEIERLTFALGDRVVDARRTADRGRYATLELIRRYRAARPGPLRYAAPVVRFTYADEIVEDLLGARRADDRRTAEIPGDALDVTISELPADGRPPSFTGAIGTVKISATADRTEVEARRPLKLTLRFEATGEVSAYAPPRLDDLKGFHVLGRLDDAGSPIRTVTYEIAPRDASVTEIPAIAFATFDPDSGTYRTISTQPIPLRVREIAGATPSDREETSDAANEAAADTSWLPIAVALLAVVVIGMLIVIRRGNAPPPIAPERRRVDDALNALQAHLDRPEATDLDAPFAEYLAARLDCPAAAVVTPDLANRLKHAGTPPETADRAAALLEHLVGARYGGTIDGDVRERARSIIDELGGAAPSTRVGR